MGNNSFCDSGSLLLKCAYGWYERLPPLQHYSLNNKNEQTTKQNTKQTKEQTNKQTNTQTTCLLYTSDAADE